MATTHLSCDKRNEIMRNVGKLIPHTSSYKLSSINRDALETYKEKFIKLSLDQIVKDPNILTNDYTIGPYNKDQVFTKFDELYIAIPKLYTPQTKDQFNNDVPTLGESVGNTVLICINLNNPIWLPKCHEYNRWGSHSHNAVTHNKVEFKGELLDLYISILDSINGKVTDAYKHNHLYAQTKILLEKFTTTKQLTNTWPTMESFIPPEYLSKAIKQKKAKRVPLTLEELKQIDAINKEILIQKMLKGI